MGTYVRTEPCPKCRAAGNDSRGDNLVRYQDGSAFCFACHHREPPKSFRPKVVAGDEDLERLKLLVGKKPPLPEKNRKWLAQYLPDEDIDAFFFFDPESRRHVFAYVGKDGLEYWEKRTVEEGVKPKCLSGGKKPFIIYGRWMATNTVAVVEDIVSALKVSKAVGALPLFGSFLSPEFMVRLSKLERIQNIVIWLDEDKYEVALATAEKLQKILPPTHNVNVLLTEKDPKCYSTEEIRDMLLPYTKDTV